MLKARISVPARVSSGAIVPVKTLISHPMETGFRRTSLGVKIPRNILIKFECLYNQKTVFHAELHPAVAANPFIAFHFRADTSGVLEFIWTDQDGIVTRYTRDISVDDSQSK
jgi:sulfur-oxidizing protein SoxZ